MKHLNPNMPIAELIGKTIIYKHDGKIEFEYQFRKGKDYPIDIYRKGTNQIFHAYDVMPDKCVVAHDFFYFGYGNNWFVADDLLKQYKERLLQE